MIELGPVQAALPHYSVAAEIGRGAWGVVFEGRHRTLERPVAIKVLAETLGQDPQVRTRFRREAQILAQLDHPNVTRVYDYLEEDGICLLVMEFLRGGTLWQRYGTQRCSLATACAVGVSAAEGLHHAHERGALHRDVKPENLMLSGQEELKVTDFGIAKVVGDAGRLTGTGTLLGTPVYMAPEQVQGDEITPATDVYALGTVVYELVAGALPFPEVSDPIAVAFARVRSEPIELSTLQPQLDPRLGAVIMQAIAREPADRFPSARAFGDALADAADKTLARNWVGKSEVTVSSAFQNRRMLELSMREGATQSGGPPSSPAGWYADPYGRFEDRYWDGARWTENVCEQGRTVIDPPG